jgi:hypothetical protein
VLQTKEVVAVGMSNVNSSQVLATLDDPIQQLLCVLLGQKRINKNGIAFTVD